MRRFFASDRARGIGCRMRTRCLVVLEGDPLRNHLEMMMMMIVKVLFKLFNKKMDHLTIIGVAKINEAIISPQTALMVEKQGYVKFLKNPLLNSNVMIKVWFKKGFSAQK